MRMNTLLHERHLLEAVRRGVITQSQAESLLNLARTEEGGDATIPDTSWLGLVQAALAGIVVSAVAISNVESPYRTPPGEELARGVLGFVVFFGLGLWLRRVRSAEAPAAVLLAGGVLQLLGVGHALARWDGPYYSSRAMGPGFVLILIAGALMWRLMRVGPALAVASFGLVGVAEELTRHGLRISGYHREFTSFTLAGVLLLGVSLLLDRAPRRGEVDGAFWTSLAAAMSLSIGMASFVDREPMGFFPAMALALVIGYQALLRRRRVLLAASGLAMVLLPPFAASEARLGDVAVAVSLGISAVAVGVAAHFARGALFARAASGDGADDRSVWS